MIYTLMSIGPIVKVQPVKGEFITEDSVRVWKGDKSSIRKVRCKDVTYYKTKEEACAVALDMLNSLKKSLEYDLTLISTSIDEVNTFKNT